jgi:hypothetical protein
MVMCRNRQSVRFVIALAIAVVTAGEARAQVCVTVDEARDTLSPPDRVAALVVLGRQFEAAGERVVAPPCDRPYTVSHVRLGAIIYVTLSGPLGRRDASARGLDDLVPLYNQMVRSLLTSQPMTLGGVVDRGNVTAAQARTRRVASDSIYYVKLGAGALTGVSGVAQSITFIGYRHELDGFAVDASFLNLHMVNPEGGYTTDGTSYSAGSWIKIEGLRYTRPLDNRSPYFGGGASWGAINATERSQSFGGSGLQGELTAGYEFGRASTIRLFVQADAELPFYQLSSVSYVRRAAPDTHKYVSAFAVSFGVGWQRGGRDKR